MRASTYIEKAGHYVETLSGVRPNRRTGSPGNREAVDFFASTLRSFGLEVDTQPFHSVDFRKGEVSMHVEGKAFPLFISPYSMSFDAECELIEVSNYTALEACSCAGKILLLRGDLSKEQLMPKNFPFYQSENHRKLIALLEKKKPAAIMAATGKNPELVGALDPFPLFVDGDFDIPSVYCTEETGAHAARYAGQRVRLSIDSERIPALASNAVLRIHPDASRKILVCAHIDAYEDTPGASDNASGTAVMMLLAEMLCNEPVSTGIELIAFNGEDHYSAGGERDYLERYGRDLDRVAFVVNVDDVGYYQGGTAFSLYGFGDQTSKQAQSWFNRYSWLLEGDPWFNGDHMIFVQKGIPALAFTAERMPELMETITHSEKDVPEVLDYRKLYEIAAMLKDLMTAIDKDKPWAEMVNDSFGR